ncbi:hypothetical protein NQ318_002823 [Aromia moschata]|uniref:Uncharacterized protein n=1 Tax=Aromia moschata TaxID=1265417 RepID=A0AAV8X3U6_9CUCU|nr:hypothetical protein NQ318_002823 [Aromia moschata]
MVNTRATRYDEAERRQEDREEAERREEKRRQEDEQRRQEDERRRQEDREEAERREEQRRQEDERRRQEDERRRQEDRDEAERRHQEICESQQIINIRLNAFSGRIDGVEQQIDQVGQKSIELRREFQENRGRNRKKTRKKIRGHQTAGTKEILEKIEGLEHQLHRTSIADSGDCSTSPATPLQHSSLMHTERGQALEILQSIPEEQQNDYDRIVGALEIRYGHKYLRQVYQSQIKSRQQRSNESLQEYEIDLIYKL